MAEITITELRKDLFHHLDRMIETGEPLHLKRHGRTVKLMVVAPERTAAEMTPQERWDRYMADGPREGWQDCPDDLDTNKSHWTWDPDTKFRDLEPD